MGEIYPGRTTREKRSCRKRCRNHRAIMTHLPLRWRRSQHPHHQLSGLQSRRHHCESGNHESRQSHEQGTVIKIWQIRPIKWTKGDRYVRSLSSWIPLCDASAAHPSLCYHSTSVLNSVDMKILQNEHSIKNTLEPSHGHKKDNRFLIPDFLAWQDLYPWPKRGNHL